MLKLTEVDLAGYRVELLEPETFSQPRRAMLFLHGHDLRTLADRPGWRAELSKRGIACACPSGGRNWWLDHRPIDGVSGAAAETTPYRFLIDDLVPMLMQRWDLAPQMLGLCGVGMGGQGALRLAYHYPQRFPVVIALSPAVDFYKYYGGGLPLDELLPTAEAARQESIILQLHPLNWPRHQFLLSNPLDESWHDGADRLAMKLSSSGILHERDFNTVCEGSPWDYFDAQTGQVIGFLDERLEKVSRSIP